MSRYQNGTWSEISGLMKARYASTTERVAMRPAHAAPVLFVR
jgi:hypothetical protein